MTSSKPSLAEQIAARASELDVHAVDAPVSGGDVGAREGTLSIMVGGDASAVAALRPCFDALGTTVVHQGGAGAGQHTKLVNQILVAGNIVAVCEALLYASRAGLDVPSVLASVSSGAAASWAVANLAPRIVAGDFAPGFFVDHFVKDMTIVLEEAARLQLAIPGLALAHAALRRAAGAGPRAATAPRRSSWRWRRCHPVDRGRRGTVIDALRVAGVIGARRR